MDEKIAGMPDGLPSPYRRDGYEHPFWLAGYKAGREQGMREAAAIANQYGSIEGIAQKIESAILAAIGEGK